MDFAVTIVGAGPHAGGNVSAVEPGCFTMLQRKHGVL